MDQTVTLTDQPDPALRDVLYGNFREHSQASGLPVVFRDLAVQIARDGKLVGGLLGRTGRGWLLVELLALPASERGQGLGRRLMGMAEAEAVARGCIGAYLHTVQFQAPGFYEKLGYREFGRLVHDDARLTRIW